MIRALCLALAIAAPAPVFAQSPRENLPIPRFVSLRSEEVNLRTGPGVRYPVEWVFVRRQMPVEVLQEFENWRRVRDREGTEGWVHQSMLAGRRTGVVLGEGGRPHELKRRPEDAAPALARIEPGVIVTLIECAGAWCRAEAGGFRGWLPRGAIWGVYAQATLK
jgi:SH3-like domain-containing protein